MITFLATPIGNLEDITIRTLNVLKTSDVILCEDTRIAKKLILLLIDKGFLDSKEYEYIPYHTHNETEFLQNIDKDFFNQNIVFLSDAGMPCISDPGVMLIRYLQENNIAYDVFGGISASTLAVAFSGIVEKEFLFLGFLPHKIQEKTISLRKIVNYSYPIVIYESPHRLLETLEILCEIDSSLEIFLAKELTKKFQATYKDSVQNIYNMLKDSIIKGEWVMVIKPCFREQNTIGEGEVLLMDIPPKIKAKILAKINGKSVKENYDLLCN